MAPPPAYFNLYALGAGLLLSLVVVAFGAVRLVMVALALKKRVEGYKTLPFTPALEIAQTKTTLLSRRLDEAPVLMQRAERAIAAIVAARDSTAQSAVLARDAVASFFKR